MKISIISFLGIIFPLLGHCQWHDLNWILGYDLESDQSLSETMILSFKMPPPSIIPFNAILDFRATNLMVSDSIGNFIFYSNGIQINSKDDFLMQGGDSINAGNVANAYWSTGYLAFQGIIALPKPGNPSQYYLFHRKIEFNDSTVFNAPEVLYTIVDMGQNNGEGAVTIRNHLVQKVFWTDYTAATKHANGRDWWVLTPDHIQNKIYSFRLTPDGIADTTTQIIGYKPSFPDSMDLEGQNIFTPNGSIFIDFDVFNGIRIYDFDRCTGSLSNFRWIKFTEVLKYGGGAAVSPNSRFLYVSSEKYIFQLDLWSNDIASSIDTIAIYDGFQMPQGIPVDFFYMQLGPDGEIYVCSPNTKYLHVIKQPNKQGQACDVRQHSILLPEYLGASWPYYPNYRLGPLDGSSCDTLGLDNHPLAGFRYEVDTIEPLLVEFIDNSYYEPIEWLWDFGEGGTSTEVNPLHAFPAAGTYIVCLTVSNQYDSDTFCRGMTVGTVGVGEPLQRGKFELYPNPAQHTVTLRLPDGAGTGGEMSIYNLYGQLIARHTLKANAVEAIFSVGDLSEGIYFVAVRQENGQRFSEKLIITR